MDRLIAMQVFVDVVDNGSQSAAADKLDMSRPVVSRYLAELEEWAGARLLHRTTRKLSLTVAGAEMLPRCRQILALATEMKTTLAMPEDAPQGLLRITVSNSFGQTHLADAVAEYVKRYPAVTVEMLLLDRSVNLVEERVDLAIRISKELDPNLIARKLSVCRSVVCASAAYLSLHGTPTQLEQLSQHNCLVHSHYGHVWHMEHDKLPVNIAVKGNIRANDATSLIQATLAGAGIALLPTYLAALFIQSGQLLRLLPNYQPQEFGIYGVYASRKHMPVTLRTMLDFLAQRFTLEPEWDNVS